MEILMVAKTKKRAKKKTAKRAVKKAVKKAMKKRAGVARKAPKRKVCAKRRRVLPPGPQPGPAGPKETKCWRFDPRLTVAIHAAAEKRGMTVTEFVTATLAKASGWRADR